MTSGKKYIDKGMHRHCMSIYHVIFHLNYICYLTVVVNCNSLYIHAYICLEMQNTSHCHIVLIYIIFYMYILCYYSNLTHCCDGLPLFLSFNLFIFLSYQLICCHSVTAAKIVFPLKNSGSGATNPSTTK